MRHSLARILLASSTTAMAGCSLLYNPNDLPAQVDAMPDARMIADVNPSSLMLESVEPSILHEGTGDGGSRRAVVLIKGTNIAPTGVTVELLTPPLADKTPVIVAHTNEMEIDAYGEMIAFPVTVGVDSMLDAGESIALDVRVTQDGGGTPVTQTLTAMLQIQGYDELTTMPTAALPAGEAANRYSKIELATGTLPTTVSGPVFLQSNSSIAFAEPVVARADGGVMTAGANGGRGGMGGDGGITQDAGDPGMGPSAGAADQSAGVWRGDDELASLANENNRGSGGGGGRSATLLGSRGGNGGGGGGVISLLAAGDITVFAVSAKGGVGEKTGVANPGGDGSGGAVLIRGGGAVSIGALDVTGSNPGRTRVDAAALTGSASYRGPQFATTASLISVVKRPSIPVVGGPSIGFKYIIAHEGENFGPYNMTMGNDGKGAIVPDADLKPGLSEVCLLVATAALPSPTANCMSIVRIDRPE